jgi:hypothetical protein
MAIHQFERENDLYEITMPSDDLAVAEGDVGQALGYSNKVPAPFDEMIGEIIAQLPQYCEIRAGYRLVEVKKSNNRGDGLYLGDVFFTMQKIVTGQIRKAEKAVVFVCTIGPEMESWAKRLSKDGNEVRGFIIDSIASVAVEKATDLLHDHIEQEMETRGLRITNRYSPGYCAWSVSEQHLLFSFLPANFCGITLTESSLMVPIKSVSGVIGVGSAVKRTGYMCDKCGMKDCTYQKFKAAKS